MLKNLSWEIKRPLSTNKMTEIGIFRFFNLFSKIWKIKERYRIDEMGDNAKSYPISMSTLKIGKEKLFQRYFVFLSTR